MNNVSCAHHNLHSWQDGWSFSTYVLILHSFYRFFLEVISLYLKIAQPIYSEQSLWWCSVWEYKCNLKILVLFCLSCLFSLGNDYYSCYCLLNKKSYTQLMAPFYFTLLASPILYFICRKYFVDSYFIVNWAYSNSFMHLKFVSVMLKIIVVLNITV